MLMQHLEQIHQQLVGRVTLLGVVILVVTLGLVLRVQQQSYTLYMRLLLLAQHLHQHE